MISMKTAISIPNNVFKTVDTFARNKQLSRSAVFTIAVTEYLSHHQPEDVTAQLNKVYGREVSAIDPVIRGLQLASLPKEKW